MEKKEKKKKEKTSPHRLFYLFIYFKSSCTEQLSFLVPKKEFACAVGVEVRGGAVTVPTEAAGFILSALESSGERATHSDHVSAWIRVCVRAPATDWSTRRRSAPRAARMFNPDTTDLGGVNPPDCCRGFRERDQKDSGEKDWNKQRHIGA